VSLTKAALGLYFHMSHVQLKGIVSAGFETNGKGHLGFIVELPGAFVRGKTERQALDKVKKEVDLYLKWLGMEPKHDYEIRIVQRHKSNAVVEDADTAILLQADRGEIRVEEFKRLADLARYSKETFVKLYTSTQHKDWIDESRIRKTFYGDNPATIQRIFDHVRNCQFYYLSRIGITEEMDGDFADTRELCLEKLGAFYMENNNLAMFEADGELWTLKKVLRRFIWHDRIHAKAITRILERQRQLGIIKTYDDPFHFMKTTNG